MERNKGLLEDRFRNGILYEFTALLDCLASENPQAFTVLRFLLQPLRTADVYKLLRYNAILCLIGFALLQVLRPYFFLTDDNLSAALPILTEIGRHLKEAQSPFISEYLYGGGYDLSRDPSFLCWHPFYLLSSLLADTPARFCLLDSCALLLVITTAIGFSLLSAQLVQEFNPGLPVIYILFFTVSFLFSSYILVVTSAWLNFLFNQSALPWLALGVLDRKVVRGIALVGAATIHQLFGAYAASTISSGICLSAFAMGIALMRRSSLPLLSWMTGNILALAISAPFLVHIFGGFLQSSRAGGVSLEESFNFSMPVAIYPFSFLLGNWTSAVAALGGDAWVQRDEFPCASVLMASAASWCLFSALFRRTPWRRFEWLLGILIVTLVIMTIRPLPVARLMHALPLLRSTRWPFRECLQLLFFFHLFLLVRHPGTLRGWSPALAVFSFLVFVLPLPFGRSPTLNPLFPDREAVLSGDAQRFWSTVKTYLKPTDCIATVIKVSYLGRNRKKLAYSIMGTANFPALYQVRCASGYSQTVPKDQLFLKTPPDVWLGAYQPSQIEDILAEKPDLKLVEVEGVDPMRIAVVSHDTKAIFFFEPTAGNRWSRDLTRF